MVKFPFKRGRKASAAVGEDVEWEHVDLYNSTQLIALTNCHYDASSLPLTGWPGGWMCTQTEGVEVVLDLGKPTLLTKLRMMNTNILSSPREMELHSSPSKNGPWKREYAFTRAQCNRLGLEVPGNTDTEMNESESEETFYFLGGVFSDHTPHQTEISPFANRGEVTLRPDGAGVAVARFWKFCILSGNGSHYIGINGFRMFGIQNPLPSPENVNASAITGKVDGIQVTWSPVANAAHYDVLIHTAGLSTSCQIERVPSSTTSYTLPAPFPPHPLIFQVVAIDRSLRYGVPSPPTAAVLGDADEWLHVVDADIEAMTNPPAPAKPSDTKGGKKDEGKGGKGGIESPLALQNTEGGEERVKEQKELEEVLRQVQSHLAQLSIADFSKSYNSQIEAMLRGECNATEIVKPAEQVTLFVSSTFDDTTTERNYLTEHVFPRVRAMCEAKGLTFSTVDLRWGVRNEATDDHMTIDICLGELNRCLRNSTAVSFVFLAGERYGWRALPNRVDAGEFELILSLVEGRARKVMEEWYECDSNAIPAVYILRRISSMANAPKATVKQFWNSGGNLGAEGIMGEAVREALRARTDDPRITPAIRKNWMVSVTEREVELGLSFDKENTELASLVMVRTITNLEEAVRTSQEAGKYYTAPEEDRRLLGLLRDTVEAQVPAVCLRKFEVAWDSRGISTDCQEHLAYVRQLGAEFTRDMQDRIDVGLRKRRLMSSLEKEVYHHSSIAWTRSKTFFGRDNVLSSIRALIASRPTTVKCVLGASGVGKTSAMSKIAVTSQAHNRYVLVRLCGTSAEASNALELMRSLSHQLASLLEPDTPLGAVKDFDGEVEQFHRLLALSSPSQRILVVIDSLDQLSNEYSGRTKPWGWLPSTTTPYTTILVSTLPEAQYGVYPALSLRLKAEDQYTIPPLKPADVQPLLKEWLAHAKRQLTDTQMKSLSKDLQKQGSITMLHLRLVHDRVLKWRSSTAPERLNLSVLELVEKCFRDLEAQHGAPLVKSIVALLCASRGGLSDESIMDLVSASNEVLGDPNLPIGREREGKVLQYHNPPIWRLPPLVFTRFKRDLRDFVVERGSNGVQVISFYHRQFWEKANALYLSEERSKTKYTQLLADYYSGKLANEFPDRLIAPNPIFFPTISGSELRQRPNKQRLHELPRALATLKRWPELATTICNLEHIEAAFISSVSFATDLVLQYQEVLNSDAEPNLRSSVMQFYRFISKWFHPLCVEPSLLAALATNSPAASEVSTRAMRARAGGAEARVFLQWFNKAQSFDPCVASRLASGPLFACAFSPSGALFALAGEGGECVVVETLTSRVVCIFKLHKALVHGLAFAEDSTTVMSVGRDKTCRVWDTATGEQLSEWSRDTILFACAWIQPKSGPLQALVGGSNTIAYIVDSEGGSTKELHGHTAPVLACAVFPGGETAVTGSWDGTAILWDVESARPLRQVRCHSPANGIAIARDGEHFAIATDKHGCQIWKSVGREMVTLMHTYNPHCSEIWACAFSSDGREILTVGADRKGRVVDVNTGAILTTITGHAMWIKACDWRESSLLTVSADKLARVWDRQYLSDSPTSDQQWQVFGLVYRQDRASGKQTIHVLTQDLTERVLDRETLEVQSERATEGTAQDCGGAELCPSRNEWAYTPYSNTYNILSPESGRVSTRTLTHQGAKVDVANKVAKWNPIPSRYELFTAGHGNACNACISDPSTGKVSVRFQNQGWVNGAEWSGDGKYIVTASTSSTDTWDVAVADRPIASFPPGNGVAVSPVVSDRKAAILLCTGGGYSVHITGCIIVNFLDANRPRIPIDDCVVRCDAMQSVAWSNSGRHVYISSSATTEFGCPAVSVFDAATGHLLTRFCSPDQSPMHAVRRCSEPDVDTVVTCTYNEGKMMVLTLVE